MTVGDQTGFGYNGRRRSANVLTWTITATQLEYKYQYHNQAIHVTMVLGMFYESCPNNNFLDFLIDTRKHITQHKQLTLHALVQHHLLPFRTC